MRLIATLVASIAAVSLACAEVGPGPGPTEPESIWSVLADGEDIWASGGSMVVTGRYTYGERSSTGRVEIAVTGGRGVVTVDPDLQLWLDELELHLADLVVYPDDYPIELTNLRLTLAEPVGTTPIASGKDPDRLELHAEARFVVDWALISQLDGTPTPRDPVEIGPLPLVLAVSWDDDLGMVSGQLVLVEPGQLWSWAGGLLALEDATAIVPVTSVEPTPPEP